MKRRKRPYVESSRTRGLLHIVGKLLTDDCSVEYSDGGPSQNLLDGCMTVV